MKRFFSVATAYLPPKIASRYMCVIAILDDALCELGERDQAAYERLMERISQAFEESRATD